MTEQAQDYEGRDHDEPEAPMRAGWGPNSDGTRVLDSQCKAVSRATGNRCGNAPTPGATVCRFHGGAAPQVKRKAALRLLELVDPAITTLAREMVQADKSSDRQRAANSILDRAGMPRAVTSPDGEAAKDLLVERLRMIREQQERDGIAPETYDVPDDETTDDQPDNPEPMEA